MDLFSATMSLGTEDKQVVSLLEYGLNYVSSPICLVIGHIFPLSNSGVALHAVCDVPLEVKAGEIQHRNVLQFFPLHIFLGHWIIPLLQLYCCVLCIRSVLAGSRLRCSPLNPAAAGRTSACSSTVIFTVSRGPFGLHHQFDQGFHCMEGGERSCMHLMLWSLIFWTPWCENERKRSQISHIIYGKCVLFFFFFFLIIKRSDLKQISTACDILSASVQLLEIIHGTQFIKHQGIISIILH